MKEIVYHYYYSKRKLHPSLFVDTFTFTILILVCIEYREDNFVIPSTLYLGCKCCYKVLQDKHGLYETEAGYEYDECIERLESRVVLALSASCLIMCVFVCMCFSVSVFYTELVIWYHDVLLNTGRRSA